jgi:hypothetical protein
MTAFFVRTDSGASGPFTGVELREAALAGLLTPETVISGTPSGPWTPAYEAGLFSEGRIPLPHPAGVTVPTFHVSGLSPSCRGPFKLRELIGFAARGLLPPDATLRTDSHAPWILVTRINILAATLKGDLALIDGSGKVIRRTARSSSIVEQSDARAPVEIAKPAVHVASELLGSDSIVASDVGSDSRATTYASEQREHLEQSVATERESYASRRWGHSWVRLPRINLNQGLLKRTAAALVLAAIVATAGYAVTHRKPTTIAREAVIGDWLVPSEDDSSCLCVIALRADGRCVVFNVDGPCWTGRYRWTPRSDDSRGLRGVESVVELDTAVADHPIEPVGATDGYLRFIGDGDASPQLDGHPISDAFVQRIGDQMRIGYPVSIEITADRKQLNAAWIAFNRLPHLNGNRQDGLSELAQLPKPNSLPFVYGIPEEARPIQPHEVPREKMAERYVGAQYIRYGNHRFALTLTESWQPVRTAPAIGEGRAAD